MTRQPELCNSGVRRSGLTSDRKRFARGWIRFMNAGTLHLFNASSFDATVAADIFDARESVVMFSGFVTPRRVGELASLLRLKIKQGVKIRCVTRPPQMNGSLNPARGRKALDSLESIGCAVDCRARIHEKVVLIDKRIVWHGSLNFLSHAHRSDEIMIRVVNTAFAQAVAAHMAKVSKDRALQAVADGENPRCGACGHRSFYDQGTFSPFFFCEASCGWIIPLKTMQRQENY